MITWLLIFIVIGGIVAYLMTGSKDKTVEGAVTGGAIFFTILQILLPLMLMIFLFKACFG